MNSLKLGDREFIFVGTAHISEKSIEDVNTAIEEMQPDTVCVEIDEDRYRNLINPKSWSSMNISAILRKHRGLFMLISLALSAFQRRLGVNMRPGEEMLAAIRKAEELGISYRMIDRKVNATLLRVWRYSNFLQKNKVLAILISMIFEKKHLEQEEIEKLREHAEIDYMIEELAKYLPSVKHVLIDERDQYLAHHLYQAQGKRIVAVVGAGHVQGMKDTLHAIHDGSLKVKPDELDYIPPPSRLSRILPWAIPIVILSLIGRGFVIGDWQTATRNIWQWIIINGGLAAIGSLLVLAHPLTILATFLAAPLTSLNPTIGVGMVSGILESIFRKPQVTDFENMHDDITSLRGWLKNRVTHIFLVFLLSSIGSAVGTFIAFPLLWF